MADSTTKRNPPLAGRPPFATDERDSIYDDSPQPARRRQRQPKPEDNRSDSTYDVYDNYLEDDDETSTRQSGYGALGMGFLNGEMDDDDSDDETLAVHPDPKNGSKGVDEKSPSPPPPANFNTVQIVAPKPGYAANAGALHDTLKSPEPTLSPVGHESEIPVQMQMPSPQMRQAYSPNTPSPINTSFGMGHSGLASPRPAFMPPTVPSTPHPLPPSTPITPQFARPPKKVETDVKFSDAAILRGKNEELILPRRGEKGDDFWRRFSMVVKEEDKKRGQSSWWLKKTQSGSARLSIYVWIVGLFLLIAIGGAIGLGLYVSHNNPSTSNGPKALGGSENQGATLVVTSSASSTNGAGALEGGTSKSKHVSPTNTINDKRDFEFLATPTVVPDFVYHVVPTGVPTRHKRTLKRVVA